MKWRFNYGDEILFGVEHSHRVNFVTTVLVIFFGSVFNLFFFPFKLAGFGVALKKTDTNQWVLSVLIWLFFFYALWLAFFATVSTRYLSVILVPLSILTAIGIFPVLAFFGRYNPVSFTKRIINFPFHRNRNYLKMDLQEIASPINLFSNFNELSRFEQVTVFILLSTSYLFYYPFVPFDSWTTDPTIRLYLYHSRPLSLILHLLAAFMILWLSISIYERYRTFFDDVLKSELFEEDEPQKNSDYGPYEQGFFEGIMKSRDKIGNRAKFLLVFILIASPVSIQVAFLTTNQFDIVEFQEFFYYDNRESVRDLAAYINTLKIDPLIAAIGVNIPGLEVLTERPFIDLWVLSLVEDAIPYNFRDMNITQTVDVLISYNVRIIISLTANHSYYQSYLERFVPNFPFLEQINEIQEPRYVNDEFEVFLI